MNSNVLFPSSVEIVAEGRKRRLVFKSARLTDGAEYSCKANDGQTYGELLVERKGRAGCIIFGQTVKLPLPHKII